jgi:hypothetical protein
MRVLRSLFGVFVIFAILYGGWKIAPPYFANFQLESAMDDAARSATVNSRMTDNDIRAAVMREVETQRIPMTEEQVLIERPVGEVFVSGDYTVHVDMPLYSFDLHFHPMSKNKKRTLD